VFFPSRQISSNNFSAVVATRPAIRDRRAASPSILSHRASRSYRFGEFIASKFGDSEKNRLLLHLPAGTQVSHLRQTASETLAYPVWMKKIDF
jgi:hypothetical protein